MNKILKEIVVSIIKIVFHISMFLIFFISFGKKYEWLLSPTRTSAVIILVFSTTFFLFSKIYTIYNIGVEKSKSVINSTLLSVMFTSILSYIFLMVMNTNPNNPEAFPKFQLDGLNVLLLVLVVQYIFIVLFTYFGNYIYFELNKPLNTIILFDSNFSDELDTYKIQNFLGRYRKQYLVIQSIEVGNGINVDFSNIDFVVIAEMDPSTRDKIIGFCYEKAINFSYSPNINDISMKSGHSTTYDDKSMVDVTVSNMKVIDVFLKRLIDILVSLFALVLSSPLWLIIAISIKMEDKGPIFFTQERQTKNAKVFNVIKFRSMYQDDSTNSVQSAQEGDDRITKTGAIIRKLRVDELPQFLNILLGDMSIVGPRPEMISNVESYESELPEFKFRLRAKAGLTGLAQIDGKYNTSPKDKLLLDLFYIENFSIWLDIKLIFRTLIIFFKKDSTEGF